MTRSLLGTGLPSTIVWQMTRARTAERGWCALALKEVRAMVSPSSNFRKNKILAALSNADLALLQPDLEPVELEVRKVLESPNKPIKHSYFIERGLASIVAGNSHKRLEVGLIGPEGMTGLAIILGNDRSPHENFIQVAGVGSRIPADNLREAMRQSRSLEKVFLRFAHSL